MCEDHIPTCVTEPGMQETFSQPWPPPVFPTVAFIQPGAKNWCVYHLLSVPSRESLSLAHISLQESNAPPVLPRHTSGEMQVDKATNI